MQAAPEFLGRDLPLARLAGANTVHQYQQLVKFRIVLSGEGHGTIEWLQGLPPLCTAWVGPDCGRLATVVHELVQRRCGTQCRYAAAQFAPNGRKSVPEPVQQELLEVAPLRRQPAIFQHSELSGQRKSVSQNRQKAHNVLYEKHL